MKRKFNLQMFANEQNVGARSYAPEYKELLPAVFKSRSYFNDFFGGTVEALDGVQHNAKAFKVKTSNIPVAIASSYTKTANVGFGTGTGSTNRFGNRTEVIYTDVEAEYTWEWSFHEGLDRHTVNNDLEAAVADRLELQAQAITATFNKQHGKFISTVAGKSDLTIASYTADNVLALFDSLSSYFVDIEAVGTKRAKVNSSIYNCIVNHNLNTTSKNGSVNIADNEVIKFKGFIIEEVPSGMFQTGECCYAYIENVGKAFTGIVTTRTIESEDFDGYALQGAGKAGEFILDVNKKAVAKVTYTGA